MMKICILLASCLFINVVSANYMRVCRYDDYIIFPPPEMDFDIKNIDPFLCTHIIKDGLYFFTGDNIAMANFKRILRPAKRKNPDLKIIASLASLEQGLLLLRRHDERKRAIERIILKLRQHDFDGLDMTRREFFREFYKAFEEESIRTRRSKLTLSATVPGLIEIIDKNYDIPEIAKYVDFLHVQTFNLYKKGTPITSHHTAMADDGVSAPHRHNLTVPFVVDYLIQHGIPPYKMTLGLSTFGRTFELKDGSVNGLGSPTTGNGGEAGPYTRERGVLSYPEICKIKKELTFVDYDYRNKAKASYAYSSSKKLWIAFDDANSLVYKITTQIKAKGLAGACIQGINLDDANGIVCGEGKNPLITAIKDELGHYSPKKSC